MENQENSILSNEYGVLARIGQHQGDSYTGRGAKLRLAERPKNMPDLIGAIDQGTSSNRFLVFENQAGHLIASSQMEIKRITPKEGWVEIDPISIMSSVHATIANVYDQLVAHYNLANVDGVEHFMPNLLSCIGICNQRESAVVWDSQTGQPLYNVIVWMDNRTKYIVDEMIDSIPGRDFNRFKDQTGLPMSTYFSAFKLKWLMDNVDQVKQALIDKRLLFGTVDSWILWNLTGGKHLTDVTNASRTFLMDIETLQWDKSLCKHFKVPMNILPEIKASADDFGLVQCGPFYGTPITGVIGDQSAALFGHNCLQIGQTKATFGTGCFIMQNIGPGPISGALSGVHRDAKRGLVTTVGYKLGDRPACYALEGSIKIAGAALTWLRDNIQLIQNYEECDILVNKTTHSAGVFFVPALGGLYSPYWDPNAAGMFIGLSQFTRREHLVRATFDSIAFQTNDILSLMRGVANGLMIDGGLCKSDNLCQILADITGYDIIRPSMCETSALGAAMVAGYGAGLWSYESMLAHSNEPLDISLSHPNQTHHYPQESLNYDSSSAKQFEGESGNRFKARTKSMTSNDVAARHRHDSVNQNRAALAAANQQHHRQHLRSANGVNDDAGGGEEGDRGGGGLNYEDHDDAASAASTGQSAVTTSNAIDLATSAIENSATRTTPLESSLESSDMQDRTILAKTQVAHCALAPPSSGYSSGDHFEQATSVSGASQQGRVDSKFEIMHNEVEDQEDDLVHEFGGRDSYGEDGYDSSSASFDSYVSDDDGDNEIDADYNDVQPLNMLPMKDIGAVDASRQHEQNGHTDQSGSNKQQSSTFTKANRHRASRRQRKSSVLTKQMDVFQSYISIDHRSDLVSTWRQAVERSMQWTRIHHEEIKRIDYQRLSSLPISMYLFFSIGMVALSGILSTSGPLSAFASNGL